MRKPNPKNKHIKLPRLPTAPANSVKAYVSPRYAPLKGTPTPISGNAADITSHLRTKPALNSSTTSDRFDTHDRTAVGMIIVAEGRAAAGAAGTQRIRPFRGENTFVISEAAATGFRRISLGVESGTLAERDGVPDMLVAENVSTPD